ncbi:MFS transporter [Janthinobacterium agaricidamnosum]|uniref:Sugar (And other) transporter family protein n=1 Tax=Janthinobacterium agaricidamnosum NBRC 102515 = DSM 9628 TaxID=1349767 RepID=W0V010_9BURK|nr:MFS transporter [Janthinobacterium agaricidamnosum]CDG80935.1 sugar (and other) transporter family protein [Janthinobacterium agaricidamnosum NBRC 102515 = DSM 9628]
MQTQALDVLDFINRERFSRYQWMIFALCFFIVLLDGFDTAAIGFIAPSLMKDWGIAKPDLAPVLSAALFGLAAGALTSGPLADRYGRRVILLVSIFIFGSACGASAFSSSLQELTVLRFITGLGLGAAMPNAVTLTSEFSPDARRATLTNAMFCGFPLGAALGGFLVAWMIPIWGWRSVLIIGGAAPLVLMLVMLFTLPESVRHMVAKAYPAGRIRAVLSRISATAAMATSFTMKEAGRQSDSADGESGIAMLFQPRYLVGTCMLWLAYFMGLMIFYALVNWMPVLFKDAGLTPKTATLISALFPLGGVGAVLFGWLMDRYNANRVIASGYALTAVAIYGIGQVADNVGLLTLVVFVAGALMNTAQSSLPALAAAYYPTRGRATGVAWMLGLGRFGGIAGSFLVAELSRRQVGFAQVFTVVALAALVSMVALLIKQAADRHKPDPVMVTNANGH